MVGNIPNFNETDLLRAFMLLDEKEGRQELCQRLGLGEGTVRSILDILKEKGLIKSTNKGHVFTDKGSLLRKKISSKISTPKEVKLHFYKEYKRVGLVYKSGEKVNIDYTLRDHAVKNGAEGAIILRYDQKKGLCLDYDAGYSFEYLEDKFELKQDNLLIITFAKNLRDAENAALAVAEKISGGILKI